MAIVLEKGKKVNLTKKENVDLGEIKINLNWDRKQEKGFLKVLFGKGNNQSVDLDLGCLYELKDGRKGSVQALGNHFRMGDYIILDGDDRSGDNANGENMTINGNKISEIKRIVLYTFIYEGVANWQETNGVITIKAKDHEDIIIHMDNGDNRKRMCALAMITNENDNAFSIEKLVTYHESHKDLDKTYNWGLRWVAGRK